MKLFNENRRLTGGKKLINDLAFFSGNFSISDEDEDFLPVILSAARGGIDIAKQYPKFYQKMLSNPALHEAFLDALETLENDRPAEQTQPNGRHFNEQAWLNQVIKSLVETLPSHSWLVILERGIEQLQTIFFPLPTSPVRRSESSPMQDVFFRILRESVEVDDIQAEVMLEAIQKVERPNEILPTAWVYPDSPDLSLSDIRLRLSVGSYSSEAKVDDQGQAVFPPVPRTDFLDDEQKQVTTALVLSLTIHSG